MNDNESFEYKPIQTEMNYEPSQTSLKNNNNNINNKCLSDLTSDENIYGNVINNNININRHKLNNEDEYIKGKAFFNEESEINISKLESLRISHSSSSHNNEITLLKHINKGINEPSSSIQNKFPHYNHITAIPNKQTNQIVKKHINNNHLTSVTVNNKKHPFTNKKNTYYTTVLPTNTTITTNTSCNRTSPNKPPSPQHKHPFLAITPKLNSNNPNIHSNTNTNINNNSHSNINTITLFSTNKLPSKKHRSIYSNVNKIKTKHSLYRTNTIKHTYNNSKLNSPILHTDNSLKKNSKLLMSSLTTSTTVNSRKKKIFPQNNGNSSSLKKVSAFKYINASAKVGKRNACYAGRACVKKDVNVNGKSGSKGKVKAGVINKSSNRLPSYVNNINTNRCYYSYKNNIKKITITPNIKSVKTFEKRNSLNNNNNNNNYNHHNRHKNNMNSNNINYKNRNNILINAMFSHIQSNISNI
jgi:hypothetical protein